MISEPTFEFLAIRLRKGGRQQFIANWSLKTILTCLGHMAQDSTHGCGLRINHSRARKLANNWLAESGIPFTSPLVLAIESPNTFRPLSKFPDSGFGIVSLPFSALIDVADGIHRIAAIRQMDLSPKILVESEWPVELIECKGGDDAAKLTSQLRRDLRPRRPPTKS
ncbi:MAG: DNA sulfur modification protein DndB [Verrucomicrobiales bacterium]